MLPYIRRFFETFKMMMIESIRAISTYIVSSMDMKFCFRFILISHVNIYKPNSYNCLCSLSICSTNGAGLGEQSKCSNVGGRSKWDNLQQQCSTESPKVWHHLWGQGGVLVELHQNYNCKRNFKI